MKVPALLLAAAAAAQAQPAAPVPLLLSSNPPPAAPASAAGSSTARELLARAQDAQARGLLKRAGELADQAVLAAPEDLPPRVFRLRLSRQTGRLPLALDDLNRLIQAQPERPDWWQQRGEVRFKLGELNGAVADFDEVIRLRPATAPRHWQRGIALFYAGRHADGRDQFARHRQVNPDDVENAAWHYLCVAKLAGADEARRQLLPVGPDPRVPMKEIHALYAGRGTAEQVRAAAEQAADPAVRAAARFYADLYLGLFEEAAGRRESSARLIAAAAKAADAHGYMGDVARVHEHWLAEQLAGVPGGP
jgi:lipoprotein NlpI